LADRIAEADVDLRRIRRARHDFLSRLLSDPNYETKGAQKVRFAMFFSVQTSFAHRRCHYNTGVRPGLAIAASIPLTLAVVFSVMQISGIDMYGYRSVLVGASDLRAATRRRRAHSAEDNATRRAWPCVSLVSQLPHIRQQFQFFDHRALRGVPASIFLAKFARHLCPLMSIEFWPRLDFRSRRASSQWSIAQ